MISWDAFSLDSGRRRSPAKTSPFGPLMTIPNDMLLSL